MRKYGFYSNVIHQKMHKKNNKKLTGKYGKH